MWLSFGVYPFPAVMAMGGENFMKVAENLPMSRTYAT
jgi:hypothetical protein